MLKVANYAVTYSLVRGDAEIHILIVDMLTMLSGNEYASNYANRYI